MRNLPAELNAAAAADNADFHTPANGWLARQRAAAAAMPREEAATACRAANRAYDYAERVWRDRRAAARTAADRAADASGVSVGSRAGVQPRNSRHAKGAA